ncbi:MAG: helix-turn-helix domain-containing protein [Bacteroides sp.]|nr:helix-turn-helix domain-containing protein [Bacteroides sp.]
MKDTMGKTKTLILNEAEHTALENAYRFGSCHRFRMRCKAVLMRADGVPVPEISTFVGYIPVVIYRWLKRYREQGLDDLREKGGRGVKPLMDSSDRTTVEEVIRKQPMSVKTAKVEWEESSGKKVSDQTFRRFLAALTQDISV